MKSSDIQGHKNQRELLARAAGERLAHAYLFVGPESIGKKLVALNFAKGLNCEKVQFPPCDNCSSCKRAEAGNHIDIQIYTPRGLSRQLKVEQVEQFINQVNLRPYEGKRKVFILADAERANPSFQNKILKVLEEPPDATVIILTTSNPNGLLPTIRSRCQIMSFSRLATSDVEKILVTQGASPEESRLAASLSQGQVVKALQWLDKDELKQRRSLLALISSEKSIPVETVISMASELESHLKKKRDGEIAGELSMAKQDAGWSSIDESARSQIEEEIKADAEGRFRQEASEILNYLASLYRDMLLLKETGREDMVLNVDIIDELKNGSKSFNCESAMRVFNDIDYARESISRNIKISNCFESLLLKITTKDEPGVDACLK